jgi:hypothetical protein
MSCILPSFISLPQALAPRSRFSTLHNFVRVDKAFSVASPSPPLLFSSFFSFHDTTVNRQSGPGRPCLAIHKKDEALYRTGLSSHAGRNSNNNNKKKKNNNNQKEADDEGHRQG